MLTRAQLLAARLKVDPSNQVPYENANVQQLSRFADEPEPTEDDMIVTHYLKHHPMYEFRNLEEFHVDPYRHWFHGRVDYHDTETSPAKVHPWEQGSKFHHCLFLAFPFLAMMILGNGYLEHLKQKNVRMPIIGIFSQNQV